jgi:cytidylate kinase
MQKSNNISITGSLGAGKSTITKLLCEKLGFEHFVGGSIMRKMAIDMGIDLVELGNRAKLDPSIDKLIDDTQKQYLETHLQNTIIDSRLGFFFAPYSFRLYLTVSPIIAAERILHDIQTNPARVMENKPGLTITDLEQSISKRNISEKERYAQYY